MAQWSSGTMLALGYASVACGCERSWVRTPVGPVFFFFQHSWSIQCSSQAESVHQGYLRNLWKTRGRHCYATRLFDAKFVPVTRPWTAGDSRATFPSMVLTVHKDDYKHSKEAFVSGMTGSTVSHVNMIALVALVCLHPLLSRGIC